jgi:hypothetical protein
MSMPAGHQNDGTFAVAAMKRVSPIRI